MDAVLIAGAGPVGLAAANLLADAGIAVTVLEAEPNLPENLRASTFQPPTLDMLAKLGAARRLIEMGRVAPKVQYRDRAGWLAEFDFGAIADQTAHPFRVQCEQYKLNQVLAARLMHFPHARLEYSSEVTAVEQDERSVTVTAGARKVKGAWLIGAGVLLLLVSCWAWHKNGMLNPLGRNARQSLRKQPRHDPPAVSLIGISRDP